MTTDAKSSLTRQLIEAIRQTDEWDRIWKENPELQEAKAQLDTVMEQVAPQISKELHDNLWSALHALIAATENTSILYGMHVNAALAERV